MSAMTTHVLTAAADIEERGVIGIRVDIADLGACLTECAPELPPTGLDGTFVVLAAFIGAALLVSGILFAVTRRRFPRWTTDER